MKKIILTAVLAAAMCVAFAACGEEEAMQVQVTAGEETILEDGIYDGFTIDYDLSGTKDSPTIIRAAEGASPVIKVAPGEVQSGETDELEPSYGIYLCNAHDVILEGITVEGGTHGIIYESLPDKGVESFDNITIKNCKVSGVVGAHGICFYAANDFAPVRNVTVEGCEVSDCLCGDSESLVLNGNIDGFTISNNRIHDNNNIGIDMIGFEGTAMHPEDSDFENPYDTDMARNGKCFGNVVYNISAEGNPAYYEDGEYDLCADGIYVDGGQDIEIFNNFVYRCDIGIEIATEHSPDDNPLFKVSGIRVHDNVIANCEGWCGLCFGGYDRDLGFTEGCEFDHNTLVDNETQIGIQRSKGNSIHDNLFVGGNSAIDFNYDCKIKDLINDFDRNVWCFEEGDLEEMMDSGGYGLAILIPEGSMQKQEVVSDRSLVLDGLKSKVEGVGSSYVPSEEEIELWEQ